MSALDIFKPRPILYKFDHGKMIHTVYIDDEDSFWLEVEGDAEEDGDGGCYGEAISVEEFLDLIVTESFEGETIGDLIDFLEQFDYDKKVVFANSGVLIARHMYQCMILRVDPK